MGDIYSSAQQVVVWLGLSNDETPQVWKLLFELGKLKDFDPSEAYRLPLTASKSKILALDRSGQRKALPELPPGNAPEWTNILEFFRRPWFSRMWTFQEVVTSKRCLVYCGPGNMP